MSLSHHSETDLHRLVNVLDTVGNDRNGVFFVGRLDDQEQHEEIAQALSRRLAQRGVSVVRHRFLPELPVETSFAGMVEALALSKSKKQRSVLVVWCLEHLKEHKLIEMTRYFNACRGKVSQSVKEGEVSVPIVLLINQAIYRKYLVQWAGDLLDCLPTPFELSLDDCTQ